jgi:hypothetical protein
MKLFPILLIAVPLAAADSAISIQTHLSRTALYPGDRLEYEVRVEHPASIEFVADHLKKDQLSLDGFEILDVSSTAPTKKLFQVKFLLRTFDIGNAVATIPSFDLFYFRQGSSNNAQAETVAVPAVSVGLRSTVTDPNAPIRDSKPLLTMSTAEWLLPGALGLCALIAVIVWLIFLVTARLRAEPGNTGPKRPLTNNPGPSLSKRFAPRKMWNNSTGKLRTCCAASHRKARLLRHKKQNWLCGVPVVPNVEPWR